MKILIWTLLAMFLSSCSFLSQREGGSSYHSSAFDDRNRPPKSLEQPDSSDISSKVDPVYIRSQADYHFTLAETYSLGGDLEKAIEEYRLTLVYDPNSTTVRMRLAEEYFRSGLMSEAVEQTEEALNIDPGAIPARLLLGKLYTSMKMLDKALEQYRTVLKKDPSQYDAALFVGALLAEQDKTAEAVQHFEKLVKDKKFEKAYLAYFYIGRIHQQGNKNTDLSIKAFEKSLTAKPDFEDALLALVRVYEEQKSSAKAIKLLSSYQEKHGPKVSIAEALVRFYLEKEDFDKAFEQFSFIEEERPDDINVKYKMALILMEKKQYDKAIGYMKGILRREPRLDKIRFYLAVTYEELERVPQAIEQFLQVPVASQFYPDAILHATYLYKNIGENNIALKIIKEGIKRRKEIPEFYTLYASLLGEEKKYNQAFTVLSDAIKVHPKSAQLHFYLGSMQDKLKDTKGVIISMKKVLELDPDHVQALNYIAYTYADKGQNLDDAEKIARRALELNPDDGYIVDTLGWVLFKKEKLPEAIKTLEKAYKLKSTESIIAEHLGDAYFKHKLPQKAREMYLKAIEVESDQENKRKLQEKITVIDSKGKKNRLPASQNP